MPALTCQARSAGDDQDIIITGEERAHANDDVSRRYRPAVGFIGLGDQGLPMATAIADAGYSLHVWTGTRTLDALGDAVYDDAQGPGRLVRPGRAVRQH